MCAPARTKAVRHSVSSPYFITLRAALPPGEQQHAAFHCVCPHCSVLQQAFSCVLGHALSAAAALG